MELSDQAKDLTAMGVVIVGAGVMLRWILGRVTNTLDNINERSIEHSRESAAQHQAILDSAKDQGGACTAHRQATEALAAKIKGG